MENVCDWCQEETVLLIPIENRNPLLSSEHELVCPTCAEIAAFEHGDVLLWHAVDFKDLVNGQVRSFELAA